LQSIKRVATLIFMVAAVLANLPQAARGQGSVTDVLGRQVVIPGEAKRIVIGIYFEEFAAVGGAEAFDRVAGFSKAAWRDWRNNNWKAWLAKRPDLDSIPDVGEVEAGDFSVEKVVALRPDVILLAEWQHAALGPNFDRLVAAGIPVIVLDYNSQTLDRHRLSTELLGAVTGKPGRAAKLMAEYEAAVADVKARVARATGPKPKVYLELGNKGVAEYGNSYDTAMWGPMIEIAGGDNIAKGKVGRWAPLTPEYVLSSRPDAVFISGSEWISNPKSMTMGFGFERASAAARLREFSQRPGWEGLPAVRSKRIHAVYQGGMRSLVDYTQLQFIAKALHPRLFADMNPEENFRRFYRKYLPVEASGVFLLSVD
jgi:iron complex transport system substrate-binding protein